MHGLHSRQQFAAKVRDVHEFLDQLGLIPPRGEVPLVATYHDACHLGHAQKIREAPRRLLHKYPACNCGTCRNPSFVAALQEPITSLSRKWQTG
jgi:Fe-S oxidoreductase